MEEALNVSGTPAETFTSGNGKKYTQKSYLNRNSVF